MVDTGTLAIQAVVHPIALGVQAFRQYGSIVCFRTGGGPIEPVIDPITAGVEPVFDAIAFAIEVPVHRITAIGEGRCRGDAGAKQKE
jgi:hypothetical protein